MYQLMFNSVRQETDSVKKTIGNEVLVIPFDPDNTDYQEYLEWLAEGNEPLPADPVE